MEYAEPELAGSVKAILPFHLGSSKIGPRLGPLILGQHLGVLQDHQQMQIVADPEVAWIAVFRPGWRRDSSSRYAEKILLVGLEQRPADAPDDVAARPVLLRLDALHNDTRAGRDGLDGDAGLLR